MRSLQGQLLCKLLFHINILGGLNAYRRFKIDTYMGLAVVYIFTTIRVFHRFGLLVSKKDILLEEVEKKEDQKKQRKQVIEWNSSCNYCE